MPDKLSAYHARRDFRITPEPRGEPAAPDERPRFVVHRHDARRLHYDFRLEIDGTLKSWAVPKGPSLDPADKRLAVQVEDHPLAYADFEGVIPERQYGAGTVEIWDAGYWEPQGDPAAGYRAGKLKFRLDGGRLQGGWTLVRTRQRRQGDKPQWLLIKESDEQAQPQAADSAAGKRSKGAKAKQAPQPAAPASAAALQNAVKAALPATLDAQLATLVDAVPESGDWVYEIKFDGYRVLARIENGKARLYTRDGKDWTARLPQQAAALEALPLKNGWLDGEIVVLDEQGIPSFQQLQNAFDEQSDAQILYFLFDLPFADGHDLRATPLAQRRALLESVLASALAGTEPGTGPLRYSAPMREPPQQLLDSACQLSMEGIIGKLADSPYSGRRSSDWIKLKCRKRQEFVLAGYTDPQGARKFFGSLLLGVYGDDGALRYAGRVGTGFDLDILQSVYRLMEPLRQQDCPFPAPPAGIPRAQTHWLRPELVAEISFAEWTKDGRLRQAVFQGMREDKPATQIRREEALPAARAGGDSGKTKDARQPASPAGSRRRQQPAAGDAVVQGVKITHPERVIDASSGLTKLDLVRYYEQVAPLILPYLRNRPVYLLRAPEGVDGERFFQKHLGRSAIPGVDTLDPALDPGHGAPLAIGAAQGLAGAAQMGTIELHVCGAAADRIDRPDCMVFDLDPDAELPWAEVAEGARLTRALLEELGLKSFLKTSGGKGLHLAVPLARRHAWEEVLAFSQAVAEHLARVLPDRFSVKMGEKNRVGEIYIDFMRNQRYASTVAPYSVRARPGLPVSVPIAWEELDRITGAAMWTVATLPERLAAAGADPWRDYFGTRQTITAAMKRKIGMGK